jgi:hypothetical protein
VCRLMLRCCFLLSKVSGSSGAAAKLGIPASTLESKIRSLEINKYRFKEV